MKRLNPSSLVFGFLLGIGCVVAEPKPAAASDALFDIYYKLEVTNYCGLTSEQVLLGFKNLQRAILARQAFSQQQIDSIRSKAWQAGHKEWDNRGLGGFRRWCKNEGHDYQGYFLKYKN